MAAVRHANTRSVASVGCLTLLLAACSASTRAEESQASTSGSAVRAHYVLDGGELGERLEVDVTTTGPEQIRIQWHIPGDAPPTFYRWVYDGDRIRVYGSDSRVPHELYEAADDYPDIDYVRSLVLPRGSDLLAEACPDARSLGERTIAGADAIGYRCSTEKQRQTPMEAEEIWIERTRGLVLEAGRFQADEVEAGVPVDAGTFSTEPPEDARVKVFPAK